MPPVSGLEPDLADDLARSMGIELRLDKFQFSELLDALANGKVDMVISAMTITPERNLRFAFAGPYFVSGKCVLTKSETLASTESASDINRADLPITALKGSTSEASLPASDPLLLNFVDNLLQGLAITGRLDQLQEQWLENTSWIEQLP